MRRSGNGMRERRSEKIEHAEATGVASASQGQDLTVRGGHIEPPLSVDLGKCKEWRECSGVAAADAAS